MNEAENSYLRDLMIEVTDPEKTKEFFNRYKLTSAKPGDLVTITFNEIDESGSGQNMIFLEVVSDPSAGHLDLEDVVLRDSEGRRVHVLGNLQGTDVLTRQKPDFPVTDEYGYPLRTFEGKQITIYPMLFEKWPIILLYEDTREQFGFYNEIIPAGFDVFVQKQ